MLCTLFLWCPVSGTAFSTSDTARGNSGGVENSGDSHPANGTSFILATGGCAMAHCQPTLADASNIATPATDIMELLIDLENENSYLAPSSNGEFVAVSANGGGDDTFPELEYFDFAGNRLWSFSEFNRSAAMSMPAIAENGEVIHTDNQNLIRFSGSGEVIWSSPVPAGRADSFPNSTVVDKFWAKNTALPGGPVSPLILDNKYVIIGAYVGPVTAYDVSNGVRLGEPLWLTENNSDPYFYDTLNTPAASENYANRFYLVTQRNELGEIQNYGRFYALDVTPDGVEVAWFLPIDSPSGASPTVIGTRIFTDGGTNIYGFEDFGDYGQMLWEVDFGGENEVSFAVDPRGGLWGYAIDGLQSDALYRISEVDGSVIEQIDTSDLLSFGGLAVPSSLITIGQKPGASSPVLLVSLTVGGLIHGGTYTVALDLTANNSLLWYVKTGRGLAAWNWGQFAHLTDGNTTRIVTISKGQGVKWLGVND